MRASADDAVCHLGGCNDASTRGHVLIQQVQQQHREQIAKVVTREATAPSPLKKVAANLLKAPATKPSVQDGGLAMLAKGHATRRKRKQAQSSKKAARIPVSMPSARALPSALGQLSMMQMSSKHVGMARLAAKAAPREHTHLRGWTAPLDETGYQAIVALKSDDDMEMFIRRVIDAYDCKIVNQGGFMGVVPWFSGTTASGTFVKLQETLLYAVLESKQSPWLAYKNSDGTNGATAELSFMGYVEVAATRNEDEMLQFARRICDNVGVKVVNEDGFRGMVRWYSGADNFQDYGKLEQEIKTAAHAPKSWAAWKDPAAAH